MAIASDPGPSERLVGRTLVGDTGQRIQGFLTKLGLTSSYVLVNAFPYAVHPSNVLKFVKQIDAAVPRGLGVHVVLDDLSVHSTPEIKKWLAHRDRRR